MAADPLLAGVAAVPGIAVVTRRVPRKNRQRALPPALARQAVGLAHGMGQCAGRRCRRSVVGRIRWTRRPGRHRRHGHQRRPHLRRRLGHRCRRHPARAGTTGTPQRRPAGASRRGHDGDADPDARHRDPGGKLDRQWRCRTDHPGRPASGRACPECAGRCRACPTHLGQRTRRPGQGGSQYARRPARWRLAMGRQRSAGRPGARTAAEHRRLVDAGATRLAGAGHARSRCHAERESCRTPVDRQPGGRWHVGQSAGRGDRFA